MPFALGEIKQLRRQRLVGRRSGVFQRLAPGLVIIGDCGEALARGVLGERLHRQCGARQIIEQRLHLVVEQRQPMLHAGIAPSAAHRLVQQIVGRGGAEFLHIAGAEAADGFGDELEFGDRHQVEGTQGAFAPLRLRVEGADGLYGVAEKVEAHRHVEARRIEIENAAADRVLARLAHGGGAAEAVELEPFDNARHADDIARRHRERVRRGEVARRKTLQRGVDRGQQHRRLIAAFHPCKPRQRRHALRHHAGIGRYAVVRQAVPGREFHDLEIGTEERQRARQARHALAVAADHRQRHRRRAIAGSYGAGEIGQHQALGAVGDLRQRQRPAGAQRLGGRSNDRIHRSAGPLLWNARSLPNSVVSTSAGGVCEPLTQA